MIAFSFDVQRCSGCYACVVACQDQHDWLEQDASFRQVCAVEREADPELPTFLSIACFHCGDAPCLMACPSGAIHRSEETRIVDIDRHICIGCHSCELACPFGAPRFGEDGRMAKCDLCAARLAHSMAPACVRTCPTGALTFGNVSNLSDEKARKAARQLLKAAAPLGKAR